MIREMEMQPDVFMRYKYEPLWLENTRAISEVVGANPDNLVFVGNATTGKTQQTIVLVSSVISLCSKFVT